MNAYQYKPTLDAGTTLVEGTLQIKRVDDRYVMSGGMFGDHSICTTSTEERLRAHWSDYKANQRQSPAVIGKSLMNTQDSDAKKAKVRKQSAARQRRYRIKQQEAGYPRREFNLNDQENAAVVALIAKLREKNGD